MKPASRAPEPRSTTPPPRSRRWRACGTSSSLPIHRSRAFRSVRSTTPPREAISSSVRPWPWRCSASSLQRCPSRAHPSSLSPWRCRRARERRLHGLLGISPRASRPPLVPPEASGGAGHVAPLAAGASRADVVHIAGHTRRERGAGGSRTARQQSACRFVEEHRLDDLRRHYRARGLRDAPPLPRPNKRSRSASAAVSWPPARAT